MLLIEAKIIDSQSGALIGEAVSSMSSEKFRSEVKTKQQFQVLAETWVKSAVKAAAGYTK